MYLCSLIQNNFIMYKIVAFSLMMFALVSLTSCNNDGAVLKGSIDNVEDGTSVFVSELTKGYGTKIIDSAQVQNGSFTIHLPKTPIQSLNILSIQGVNGNLSFVNENTSLRAKLYKDSLHKSEITGGAANRMLKDYQNQLAKGNNKIIQATDALDYDELQDTTVAQNMQDLQAKIQEENTVYRKEAIEEHPDLLPSLLMLFDMEQTRSVAQPEMKKLYDGLSPQLKDHFIGQELGQRLAQGGALAIGKKAPSFKAITPEGDELALEEALGKYTLVDFWAAWCMPCRKENPNIVKVYNKYHEKGFNVLGVSLDKSKEAWLEAIKKDGLPWNQISNLRFWNDPIAKKYNIRAIPANFLLDQDGVIVDKDLRGPNLEKKIEELLGQE